MWGAVFAPVIILGLLLLPAFGVDAGANLWNLVRDSIVGRLFMLAMIVLPLWCGFHRVHHCLHDMKVHSPMVKPLCYGTALILSIVALLAIVAR
jgi:fumarate reductase subunit D